MPLKYFFGVFILISLNLNAQTKVNDKDVVLLNQHIYGEVHQQIFNAYMKLDSIQARSASDEGVVFVRFNVAMGTVKNVKFMRPGLDFVKKAIKDALLNMRKEQLTEFNKKDSSKIYILPVMYNFSQNGRYVPKTVAEILDKLPDLNLNNSWNFRRFPDVS